MHGKDKILYFQKHVRPGSAQKFFFWSNRRSSARSIIKFYLIKLKKVNIDGKKKRKKGEKRELVIQA
jgi:hypothetical protein